MNPKKFSIITPTLNEERLIEQFLSQFDADFKKRYDVEIVISDGGSTDNTLNLADGKVDTVVKHKEVFKQNISRGRNQGALNSLGDVLVFLNADTLIGDKESFFTEIGKLFSDSDVIAISGPVKVFKSEELLSDRIFHYCYNNYVRLLNKYVMGMARGECHILRRAVFLKVTGYDETLFAGEDFDLYKRIRKFGKIKYSDKVLVYESPRRYRKFGYLSVLYDWAKNSIWITLFHKSVSKVWEEVR